MRHYKVTTPDYTAIVSFNDDGIACLPCSEELLWLPRQKWNYNKFLQWVAAKSYDLEEVAETQIENSIRSRS